MAKAFKVEVTVPEGLTAGDKFIIEVVPPVVERKPRGVLAGIPVEEMTDDQLKRELINAKSVLYKAKQREASEEIIAKNQARVDAAEAEKAKRTPVTVAIEATAVAVEEEPVESVYDEAAAAEM